MVSIFGIDVILRQYGSSYGLTEARLVCLCKYICDTCGGNYFAFYKRDIKRINYVETIKFLTEESEYREPILRFNDSETQVGWSNEKIWMEALIFACNMIITVRLIML